MQNFIIISQILKPNPNNPKEKACLQKRINIHPLQTGLIYVT